MKKVLIISPTPSHPQNAGDRARLYKLVLWLQEQGFDLYFIYISGTNRDFTVMQNYWGEKLLIIHTSSVKPTLWKRIYNKTINILKINIIKAKLFYKGKSAVDERYSAYIDSQINNYLREKKFDIVLSVYVYFSKALEKFGRSTLKIIDTIDAHSIRDIRFKQNVFVISKQQEAKALQRADVVIAIQSKEKQYFESITNKKVILVGHPVSVESLNFIRPYRRKLLFIGSTYESNVMGIQYFIESIFPIVLTKFPDTELYIAGRVCEKIDKYPNCVKLGVVDNLEAIYSQTDIAINPILVGRGLKIKNIEAIGFGKPLVTTSVGAEGLEEGVNKAFLVADEPEEFAACIDRLFSDNHLYNEIMQQASCFANDYNVKAFEEFEEVLKNC